MSESYFVEGKTVTTILREAIQATGGPHSDALAAVKTYVDARYPDFPWNKHWHAQICGAKAGEFARQGRLAPPSQQPAADLPASAAELLRAQEFVEVIGYGSIAQAQTALAYLRTISSEDFDRLDQAIHVWSELVTAVEGSPEVAQRVLNVLQQSPSQDSEADPISIRIAS